ncbi:UNVERIFIED_CONTAM: hypothetical protein HDU68_004918, partial [Siphonaria sp. JEL0065]
LLSFKGGQSKVPNYNHNAPPISSDGCPPPRAALVAIFTMAGSSFQASRRAILREKYQSLNAQLDPWNQIDIKFLFGSVDSFEKDMELAAEETMFPNETLVLERLEARDTGKLYDWFKHVHSKELYSQHPTIPSNLCPKYRFVGKGDDDAVIHIPRYVYWDGGTLLNQITRLSRLLSSIPDEPVILGREYFAPHFHMTGMLYLVSSHVASWIGTSPIPASNITGIEDVVMGRWILNADDIKINRHNVIYRFHDLEESTGFPHNKTTAESVVLHWCKDELRFFRCMSSLFDQDVLRPEILKRLASPTSIRTRVDKYGLGMDDKEFSRAVSTIQKMIRRNPKTSLVEMDAVLITPILVSRKQKLAFEFPDSSLKELIHRIALRAYSGKLGYRVLDRYIIELVVERRVVALELSAKFTGEHQMLAVKRVMDYAATGGIDSETLDRILRRTSAVVLH